MNDIDYFGQVIIKTNQEVHVDADGAPNAYHPDVLGLDYVSNAGKPGNWYGVVTNRAGKPTSNTRKPLVQGPSDPYPGYYVSQTALFDCAKSLSDPARYVDSRFVSYTVRYNADGNSKVGDFAMVVDTKNGKAIHAIVADTKGSGLGEASIRLAWLFGLNTNPRGGKSAPKMFCCIIYDGNKKDPA